MALGSSEVLEVIKSQRLMFQKYGLDVFESGRAIGIPT